MKPALSFIKACTILLFTCSLFLANFSQALPRENGKRIFIVETFDSLEQWEPFRIPKSDRSTRYEIGMDGKNAFLRATSDASASALVSKARFSIIEYPRMCWRWKIDKVYPAGDAGNAARDDCPIRLYVMFAYDPERAAWPEKIQYGVARGVMGRYPPHSALNYVWANRSREKRILTSPFTDRSKMIVLREGPAEAGQWVEENVNILEDYREAFGTEPPPVAAIALMNDSDNTGDGATSYMDDIIIFR